MPSLAARKAAAVFKTEICPRWRKGNCEYGEECIFAHGDNELRERERPRGHKTRPCDKFNAGICKFGKRCIFAHGADELEKYRGKHRAALALLGYFGPIPPTCSPCSE